MYDRNHSEMRDWEAVDIENNLERVTIEKMRCENVEQQSNAFGWSRM